MLNNAAGLPRSAILGIKVGDFEVVSVANSIMARAHFVLSQLPSIYCKDFAQESGWEAGKGL